MFESLIKKTTSALKKFKKLMEKQRMQKFEEKTKKEEDFVVKTLTDFQLKRKLKDLRKSVKKQTCGDLFGVRALKYKKILLLADVSMLQDTVEKSEKKIEEMESLIETNDNFLACVKRIKREIKKRKKNNNL